MSQLPRPRGALTYNKPPLSLDDLVDRLTDRGLELPTHSTRSGVERVALVGEEVFTFAG